MREILTRFSDAPQGPVPPRFGEIIRNLAWDGQPKAIILRESQVGVALKRAQTVTFIVVRGGLPAPEPGQRAGRSADEGAHAAFEKALAGPIAAAGGKR